MEQREVFSHRPGRTPLLNRNTPIKNNYNYKENLLLEKVAKEPSAHIFWRASAVARLVNAVFPKVQIS